MENIFHNRNSYERQLEPWIDKPVIKILTGMRRVGKSCLLRQLEATLRRRGVPSAKIAFVDKESIEFDAIRDYRNLADYLKKHPSRKGKGARYLLVDEVQEIAGWEKTINSCLKEGCWDIFLTGSNAHLLSSDLATLLSGRYVEIPVYPLSLPEFIQFRGEETDPNAVFDEYLRFGGLPAIHQLSPAGNSRYQYLESVFDTIVIKDIVSRHEIRNIPLFQNIARYAFDNAGNLFSAKRVADYLKSQRLKITVDTVQKYLRHLTEAFALCQVRRYDIKGRRHLEINEKYYLGDIGLRNAVLGYREDAINALLENLVFLELKRRGHTVSIGKLGDREIDFIAAREKEVHYIQVCYLLATPQTREREFGALRDIPDNHPKTVLSMDPILQENTGGIRHRHLIDFLMGRG